MDIEELAASNVCQVSKEIYDALYKATGHPPKQLKIGSAVGSNIWPVYRTILTQLKHEHNNRTTD